MPTSLPPITQNALTGLQQARSEQLATLSKLIDITIGSTTLASVEKVAPINAAQRELLLQQTRDLIAQLNNQPKNPAAKLQLEKLVEQQKLLTSSLLKLVQLQVNGRELLTYTDKPLQQGQSIAVRLDNLQRLVQLVSLPVTGAPTTSHSALTTEQTASKLHTESLLAGLLRNLLPQKDKPQELFAALPQLQQLPMATRNQLLPPNVQQALKTLASQLRSPEQLGNPKLLAMILKNSGVQFEQKLAARLTDTGVTQNNSTALRSPGNTGLAKSLPGLRQSSAAAGTDTAIIRLSHQDLKGALLQLLNNITKELSHQGQLIPQTPPQSPVNVPASPLTSTAIKAVIDSQSALLTPPFPGAMPISSPVENLSQFLQQFQGKPASELSDKVLRTQLLLLLHQHTLSSLAKIQLQQVHSVNHQQSQLDVAQPTQSWLFEIPVRQGQETHPLEVRIDQQWVDDGKGGDDKSAQKIKQWSVMLTFNLPELGGFYAQLTLLNDSLAAKLWAEKESTLAEAQSRLDGLRDRLQAQGVAVTQLQCVEGAPPNRSISLNYALVDVTT